MRILVLVHRDMSREESGGARTVMQVNDYLASQPGIQVYTSFRNLSPVDPRITEIPIEEYTAEKLNKVILDYRIDILLVPVGVFFARLARTAVQGTSCKVVTEFHNCPGYEMRGLLSETMAQFHRPEWTSKIKVMIKLAAWPLFRYKYRRSFRRKFQEAYLLADRLVLLSDRYFDQYRKCYQLSSTDRMRAIGNALSFMQEATETEIANKEKTVLFVGRFDERHKRVSYLLRSWQRVQTQHPDWRLQLVGFGPAEAQYRKMMSELHLQRVFFEGRQSDPEPYYTRASIFVMTSAFEGWGMTLCEAQQKGCVPVVMDSFPALHDLVCNGESGCITANNDIKAFSDRIEWLMDHTEIRRHMAMKAIEYSRRFTMEQIGPQWMELFNSL